MQEYFYQTVDRLTAELRGPEVLLANFGGERSDFVRFNRSAIRQAGSVTQYGISLELIVGSRHARAAITVCGSAEADRPRLEAAMADLRRTVTQAREDPHLLYATAVHNTERIDEDRLPPADAAVEAVLAAGKGRDLVGIYASGPIYAGFGNSLGQRNWFASHSFNLDWSFYHSSDKAVKDTYAGTTWDPILFDRKVNLAAEQLEILSRPPKTIDPGRYRVYLSPAAMEEFLNMVAYGAFGLKAHRTKTTSLLKMIESDARLADSVTLTENTADGIAPNVQSVGFVKPDRVRLIDRGRLDACLISPRSAAEYSVETNGASAAETPESLDMAAGDVDRALVPARLDSGVYINQLWYLNYSDRPAGRITGLTRFATFWVEGGRIAAPLNVMRFDETVYRVLGENLIGLTKERDFLASASTYGGRSTSSGRLPGAIVKDFTFTL